MNASHGDWLALPWGSPTSSYVINFSFILSNNMLTNANVISNILKFIVS